ncbi:MAG: histidine--tRNA ligase [Planctomycetes bacterium]|nr:histidine--tRNA ligase [Planctomycetota bacterium]
MSDETRLIKPRSISGFPEWLPHEKEEEERCLSLLRETFRSFGYTPLETASVELTEVLASKGVEEKEIYDLIRHQGEGEESGLSLHFDLTVPFARYVALNYGQLAFPFKRYQIQKVWRGERPAQGRFREFYQCDIDVVANGPLPLEYDAELLEVMATALARLDVGRPVFMVNHRRILDGFYNHLGIGPELRPAVLLEVDKLEKTGRESVARQLQDKLSLTGETLEQILHFAALRCDPDGLPDLLRALEVKDEVFLAGLAELESIFALLPTGLGDFTYNGSITRGLNYYTGIICETLIQGAESFGSVCSGGRYEGLTRLFSNQELPGCGMSIGLTRLLAWLFAKRDKNTGGRSSPSEILIAAMPSVPHSELLLLGRELRSMGLNVEVFPPAKLKKQLAYADRKGIPGIIIPNDDGSFDLKDMSSGQQARLTREELVVRLQAGR